MPRARSLTRPSGRSDGARPRVGNPGQAISYRRRWHHVAESVVDLRESTRTPATPQASKRHSIRRRHRHHSQSSLPPAINGALAAASVLAMSFALVLAVAVLAWVFAADHSSLGAMFDVACYAWLGVHLVPVDTAGGAIFLPPLLLTGAVVATSFAVGRTAARRASAHDRGSQVRIIGSAMALYGVTATVLAAISATAAASSSLLLAPILPAALFGAGFAAALLTSRGGGRRLRTRIPDYVRAEASAALRGLLVLAAAGALALVVGLLAALPRLLETTGDLRPGISGTVVLVLICIFYLPNAVIWGASFLAGPGVILGAAVVAPWRVGLDASAEAASSLVSTTSGSLPPLPALPIFAALPHTAAPLFWLGALVPLVAGVVAARRAPAPATHGRSGWIASRARVAGIAAAVAGLAALLAHGSLGGNLSELGPSPLAFAGAVAVWFALGALLHAALAPLRSGGSPRVSRLPQPWRRKAAGSNATDGAVAADQDAGAGEFPAAVEDPAGIVVRTPAEEPVASLLAGPAAPVGADTPPALSDAPAVVKVAAEADVAEGVAAAAEAAVTQESADAVEPAAPDIQPSAPAAEAPQQPPTEAHVDESPTVVLAAVSAPVLSSAPQVADAESREEK